MRIHKSGHPIREATLTWELYNMWGGVSTERGFHWHCFRRSALHLMSVFVWMPCEWMNDNSMSSALEPWAISHAKYYTTSKSSKMDGLCFEYIFVPRQISSIEQFECRQFVIWLNVSTVFDLPNIQNSTMQIYTCQYFILFYHIKCLSHVIIIIAFPYWLLCLTNLVKYFEKKEHQNFTHAKPKDTAPNANEKQKNKFLLIISRFFRARSSK